MPYAYPGVYIEEDASPGLNISSSATAVPVFVFLNGYPIESNELFKVDSWLDFLSLLDFLDVNEPLYNSVKYYFVNGGGRCYVSAVSDLDINLLSNPGVVTLIVEAGLGVMGVEPAFFDKIDILRSAGCNIFALFDSPYVNIDDEEILPNEPAEVMKNYPSTDHAAVYGPWFLNNDNIDVPPSAVAAGLIARTDSRRGVWKAPANIAVAGGLSLKQHLSKEVHGLYNDYEKPLNLFREFTGKGTLLWGARTLSLDIDRWRYVSVRRLFNMVEHDIENAMRAMMFETNNQPTWEKVRAAIYNYLYALWQQGALQGAKPEEAFNVQVGLGLTMNETDIEEGKLIVDVGLKAVRPAEFIILKFTQDMALP